MARVVTPVARYGVLAMSKRERDYASVMRQIDGGLGKRSAAVKFGHMPPSYQPFIQPLAVGRGRGFGEPQDAHRPLSLSDEELSFLFCKRDRRKVTKNCDFSHDGKRYVIDNHSEIGGWRHKGGVFVDIYQHPSDTMSVFHCGRRLIVYPAGEAPQPPQAVCGRRLNEAADNALAQGNRKKHIPPPSHPWKAASYRAQRKARKL